MSVAKHLEVVVEKQEKGGFSTAFESLGKARA
jgi:hypothetical protein